VRLGGGRERAEVSPAEVREEVRKRARLSSHVCKGTRVVLMMTDGWGRSPRGGLASSDGGGGAEGRCCY
jgi:hypothetical protein